MKVVGVHVLHKPLVFRRVLYAQEGAKSRRRRRRRRRALSPFSRQKGD